MKIYVYLMVARDGTSSIIFNRSEFLMKQLGLRLIDIIDISIAHSDEEIKQLTAELKAEHQTEEEAQAETIKIMQEQLNAAQAELAKYKGSE